MISPEVLGRTLAGAPEPELARVALPRVGEDPAARAVLSAPEVLPAAVRLLGFSRAAADFLVAHPEEASSLANVAGRAGADLEAELAEDIRRSGAETGLRMFRRRALLRIAASDLAGAQLE